MTIWDIMVRYLSERIIKMKDNTHEYIILEISGLTNSAFYKASFDDLAQAEEYKSALELVNKMEEKDYQVVIYSKFIGQ